MYPLSIGTMRYYVGRNSQTTADAIWEAFEGQKGKKSGNTGHSEQPTECVYVDVTL